jgi:hypothetical protein
LAQGCDSPFNPSGLTLNKPTANGRRAAEYIEYAAQLVNCYQPPATFVSKVAFYSRQEVKMSTIIHDNRKEVVIGFLEELLSAREQREAFIESQSMKIHSLTVENEILKQQLKELESKK